MSRRLRAMLPATIGLVLFLAALEVLRTELKAVTWHTLVADLASVPQSRLWLALALTITNFAALVGFGARAAGRRRADRIADRIGHRARGGADEACAAARSD